MQFQGCFCPCLSKAQHAQKLKFAFEWVQNIMGKGENSSKQFFSLSQNVFKSLLLQGP